MRRGTVFAMSSLLLCAAAAGLTSSGTLLALSQHDAPGRARRTLTFEERVSYQRAIEDVYWRHRIWPKENAHGKNTPARRSMKLNNHEWDDTVQKLVGMFSDQPVAAGVLPAKGRPMAEGPKARGAANDKLMTHLTTGTVSPLQEDETRYYATAMVNKSAGHLKLATVSWLKEPLESWRARVEKQAATALTPPGDSYKLPPMSQGDGCVEDTWTATAGPPDARASYTAVWTGSEMIVWGGLGPIPLNTGSRYKHSTDNWVATTTTNAPGARSGHTAVWTGTEMIVWGATADTTGGRYNPVTNNWTATSTTNAPDFRYYHTAVWTGTEMVVWGGANFLALNTGGRYNPSTNS